MHTSQEELAYLPTFTLNDRQLHDLDLILNGGFAPLKGFLNKEDYESVVTRSRLQDGTVWPIPIVLDTKDLVTPAVGSKIILTNTFGNRIAQLTVESVYRPDKAQEAEKVYGTTDRAHPGVSYLFDEVGETYIGGVVMPIDSVNHADFKDLRKTPEELKAVFSNRKNPERSVIAFQTRNPIHRAHAELIRRAAKEVDADILIHPTVGPTKKGDIDALRRVRSYRALKDAHFPDATLSLAPIAMRMAGPREALWHAIIRKNYGATHFIVGRDHAGPGNDSNGKPFYGPYDAQEFALRHALEIGITIVPSKELVYLEDDQTFVPVDNVAPGKKILNISGTEFRRKLASGESIPEWFSFTEVVDALRDAPPAQEKSATRKGVTFFFTGLSGSGKSTIALKLKEKIEQEQRIPVTYLDGDVVRTHLSYGLSFSKEDRNRNVERIGFVAGEIVRHGGVAICAAIAPYASSREKAAEYVKEHGSFVEIFVKTSFETCKKRDVKGLYKKAELGLLKGMTGLDDPYEEPISPTIVIDTETVTADEAARQVYAQIY